MSFGQKTAGNTFQRAIDQMLNSHQDYAAGYIDDVSVFSDQWTKHLDHLEKVLQEFLKSGMTLKIKKCFFGRSKIQFLGHMVGGGEVSVVQSKIDAITNMPEPTTKKLLRSFLGMCNYYRTFIPLFADTAVSLTELTKGEKTGRLQFNETQRQAFNALKERLSNSTKLSVPLYDRPFKIQTDASDYAIGSCLTQIDDNGQERPLAFASSKLSDTEKRWSTLEKEAYAVVHALRQFDHIVFSSRIDLYTDHDPLQYMINANPKCMKLTRWALHLSRYDLHVHHKAGVLNTNADCMSRLI